MDCWLEPHWRSTVTPGTVSGQPAASTRGTCDVDGLLTGLADAAPDDVVDNSGVDAGLVDQSVENLRGQIGRVHPG